ncbi:penicillin acylase family protein [Halobacteriales archaeon SW_6_65_46]|nr:MAG: penicillin acylase family protein [Halobacteriales archaeon SW_6_65_46]
MNDRRSAIVAVVALALLVAGSVGAGSFISLAAPGSGDAWTAAYGANDGSIGAKTDRALTGATTVESPHGEATVRYDGEGVPHIEADSEAALYYAVGYVQARDRLFQMDLQRRLMRGETAEIAGAAAVESDRFYRKMDFASAAAASWNATKDTAAGDATRAYTAGVNHYIDTQPLPTEFQANDYAPDEWTPVDSLLVGKLIAWQLTGDFRDLERATLADAFDAGEMSELYPEQLAHDSTITGRSQGGEVTPATARSVDESRSVAGDFSGLYDRYSSYERSRGIGSNSWLVSGEHTDDGKPILANDPHLSLTVPPVWYEMHLDAPEMDTRGVAFPGLPFVVIGRTESVSWGFTNVGADQTDLYTFERPTNDTYVYGNETREIRTETETIEVADGPDAEVKIRKTVKGPLLERDGREVAVSWLGLTGTREGRASYALNHAEDLDAVREALRTFDTPTQNIVAADRDGGTLFRLTGKYPYRYTDGERVSGELPFNATEGDGEWRGWTPYGQTDWEAGGFVPYEDVPHIDNPDVLATANQRTTDEPGFYLAYSGRFADPYRGERIYERLETRVESDQPVTAEFMQNLQRDTRSLAAAAYQQSILDAREEMPADVRREADRLAGWDARLDRDSRPALLYTLFRDAVREEVFGDEFAAAGLDSSYYPHHTVLQNLPANSSWFDDRTTSERESRADAYAAAFELAVERANAEGWETYGDDNVVDLDHQFPLSFLDYPQLTTDGGPFTVSNFRGSAGSSWRMVVAGEEAYGVIPGGQSGNPYSPHYADQLDPWANGGYHSIPTEPGGPVVITFTEADE